jgi:hypothetical protein
MISPEELKADIIKLHLQPGIRSLYCFSPLEGESSKPIFE